MGVAQDEAWVDSCIFLQDGVPDSRSIIVCVVRHLVSELKRPGLTVLEKYGLG